ncbi:MAG: anthranilate phosphoribosyltransferase [Bacteroidota bacterium]
MNPHLRTLAAGDSLTLAAAEDAMHALLSGEASDVEVAALLMGTRSRGETLDELTSFTKVMRQFAVPVEIDDPDAIDVCGTGGDSRGTFNISTATAFVCAGAGATVAKHGNRSISSKCGSADVLEALGVQTTLRKAGVEHCLREAGIAFIFAPYFHPAMKHVMPVRRALGARTFFNILGPMCNPAGVRRQLVGAFSVSVAQQMVEILGRLGAKHAITVHSDDGLDELSLSAPTTVFQVRDGSDDMLAKSIRPESLGLPSAPLTALKGDDAQTNADIIRRIFDGEPGPRRDVVVLNAGFALYAGGKADSPTDGIALARTAIDEGHAGNALARLVAASNAAPTD